MAEIRAKALAYQRNNQLRLLDTMTTPGELRPYTVRAMVEGHRGRYEIRFDAGIWTCTAGPPGSPELAGSPEPVCAHASSVAMVTGWPSPGDKPARPGKGRAPR